MFEFLFKYRADLFSEGQFALLAGPLRIALCAIGLGLTCWAFWRMRGSLKGSSKATGSVPWLLMSLRTLGVAALVLMLLEPALVLRAVKPQESFVAVLADTSSSMTVADTHDVSPAAPNRAQWVQHALMTGEDPGSGDLWRRLAERFQVRAYGFGESTRRIDTGEILEFNQRKSDLGHALETVRAELTGVPLAGVVVLTDGAIAASDQINDELLRLRSAEIPVFPVVVGSERFDRDLEVQQVRVSRRALLGSTVEALVQLSYPGFAGETVSVEVRDDGRVIEQQDVELPVSGDDSTSVELAFRAQVEGARALEFLVSPQGAGREVVEENNRRTVLVEVEPGPHKVLYFEGEPRFEYKFIRRAVADDPQLQLVSLLRMADNRFYRQSVDDENELRDGFPTSRQELFKYRGLVLGSVEASFFTYEQMRMIVDFASERGGGVLFLGGSQALGEGGFAGTPLSELVPAELSDRRQIGPRGNAVQVRPTALGQTHAALQLGPAFRSNAGSTEAETGWASLPELLLLNRTEELKPGAAALLTGVNPIDAQEHLVLAHQRFGRGSSMLFLPTDSFRWQMRLPSDDQTHETFWRQLLRWLINGVEERTEVASDRDLVEVGEQVEVTATVRDLGFQPDSNAVVDAEVTAPSGATTRLPLQWDPLQDGRYRASFEVAEEGRHAVRVVAEADNASQGTTQLRTVSNFQFDAGPQNAEFFGAVEQSELMDQVAEETAGRRFSGLELDQLLDELSYSQSGVTVREERPLWNMPILLIVLLAALFGEWTARRLVGLR